MSDVLVHVYGVVASTAELPDGLTGRLDKPVRRIVEDDLAVLVSDVDEEARVRRADLLAHAHLLEAVAAQTTVIPSRFGVLLPDDDTVRRELLLQRGEELRALLQAFDGCVQVTVHASYDEDAALREVLGRDPRLAALRDSTDLTDTAGQVRLGEAVGGALAALREEAASMVIESLRPHAVAASLNEVRGAYDVVSVALLVRREDRPQLDGAVGDLDREAAGRMTLRYVGPQPPYAFLDRVDTTERSWA